MYNIESKCVTSNFVNINFVCMLFHINKVFYGLKKVFSKFKVCENYLLLLSPSKVNFVSPMQEIGRLSQNKSLCLFKPNK